MPSLRAICKSVSPGVTGEPVTTYTTFDFDAPELREWLSYTYISRQVLGVEVLAEAVPKDVPFNPVLAAKKDDDIPF